MNRVTKISAWLAIWLFIASALAIFPGIAAAAPTLDIHIQSDDWGLHPGGTCGHRSCRRADGSLCPGHPGAQPDERPL